MVCVDMLGEGFDLPALKVAAIHDPHKSLGVTLQFVGRFARCRGHDRANRQRSCVAPNRTLTRPHLRAAVCARSRTGTRS